MIIESYRLPRITIIHTDEGPVYRLTFPGGSTIVDADAIPRSTPLNPVEIGALLRELSSQWRNP